MNNETPSPSMGGAGAVAARELKEFIDLVLKKTKKSKKEKTKINVR